VPLLSAVGVVRIQTASRAARPVVPTCDGAHQPRGQGFASCEASISTVVASSRSDRNQGRCGGRTAKENTLHSPQEEPVSPDVLVNNVGTLYTFCPLTLRAKEWIDEHVQDDAQWFGHALIVEHRYAWGLAQGMKDDGLVLA
jgi:hypothetical protein